MVHYIVTIRNPYFIVIGDEIDLVDMTGAEDVISKEELLEFSELTEIYGLRIIRRNAIRDALILLAKGNTKVEMPAPLAEAVKYLNNGDYEREPLNSFISGWSRQGNFIMPTKSVKKAKPKTPNRTEPIHHDWWKLKQVVNAALHEKYKWCYDRDLTLVSGRHRRVIHRLVTWNEVKREIAGLCGKGDKELTEYWATMFKPMFEGK